MKGSCQVPFRVTWRTLTTPLLLTPSSEDLRTQWGLMERLKSPSPLVVIKQKNVNLAAIRTVPIPIDKLVKNKALQIKAN